MNNHNFWHEHKHLIKGFAITMIITLIVGIFGDQTSNFMASVLNLEKPAPFDGTALPIQEVPNWTNLESNQYSLLAAELPLDKLIELPNYDPIIFGTVVADINWSVDQDLANKLRTYIVPYMGSYELSSKEYEGSHLAVDIKAPIGTPIHAIANGKITKVVQSSGGFGKHIVIMHPNVPLLDANETTTLYSSYTHLSETNVAKGQIVVRGEIIGKSGNTGASTTPHLHFQIDKENAPWHPWWPFSSAEASAAGLNFFDGVSAGLNQTQAIEYTINPMLWVQRYLAPDLPVGISEDMHASSLDSGDSQVESEEDGLESGEDSEQKENNSEQENLENNQELVEPIINNQPNQSEPIATEIVVDASETVEFSVSENSIDESDEDEPRTKNQEQTELIANDQLNQTEPVTIFTDVDSTHSNAKAIQYLKDNEIINGYDDGSFQPDKTVNRIEALKMIFLGLNIELKPMLDLGFPDTSNQQWYSPYVGTAVNKSIAKGYPDGTFGPANTVNRAEYLKILLNSARIAPDSVDENPYADVPADAWFSSFAAYSKLKNIFPISGNLFEGDRGVTRAEVAETIYRLIILQQTGAEIYEENLEL
jgi:murein DD-endopeptidase MepM/ murein hydrolase activator NlpD